MYIVHIHICKQTEKNSKQCSYIAVRYISTYRIDIKSHNIMLTLGGGGIIISDCSCLPGVVARKRTSACDTM